MSHYALQYLRSAATICGLYDGSLPLAVFLKDHFRQHKKFGSKDRRHISHLCYCYYRLGHALKQIGFEERMRVAIFLCQESPGIWEGLFEKGWLDQWQNDLPARIKFAEQQYGQSFTTDIFPWQDLLSKTYDAGAFAVSHLVQPDLFLRVRPGYGSPVKQKLQEAGISFIQVEENCLSLPNASKIDDVLAINQEVVVQDLNSQHVASLLQPLQNGKNIRVWDCCAASGGKSILVWDKLPGIRLTASDIRDSIIQNLRKRFQAAGVRAENVFVADLSKKEQPGTTLFDLVICDAPCSGSGTWSRTPEQLYYFAEKKIAAYSALQEKISRNILPAVKPGGYLLYITCSVFAGENELITEKLVEKGMKIIQMEWLKGYDQKADSMFAVLLQKP